MSPSAATQSPANAGGVPGVGGPQPNAATPHQRALTTTTASVTGTANADWPFCLLNLLRLHDTNGATMHEHTGYWNYLLNLFGGTFGETSDLAQLPDYSASATLPSCQWFIPVEID